MIKNLGRVTVMFLIIGVLKIVFGLLIVLPVILIPVPLVVNLLATGFTQMPTIGLILSGILVLVMVPVLIFLSGVLQAYVLTTWTLTYHRLAEATPSEPEIISEPEPKPKKKSKS